MKNLRRASQILFFLVFIHLFIQTEYKGQNELGLPVRLFLDFDPLVALGALLASHAARAVFLLSLATVAATVLLGRVFCGWACPLGTIHTAIGALRMRALKPGRSEGRFPRLRPVKYFILVFVLVAALFGWNAAGFLDPISLTIRSLAIGYNPAVNAAARSLFESVYALGVPYVSPAADGLAGHLRELFQHHDDADLGVGHAFAERLANLLNVLFASMRRKPVAQACCTGLAKGWFARGHDIGLHQGHQLFD